jgi:site-specific DNA-methyltransferase (adenine-specific)
MYELDKIYNMDCFIGMAEIPDHSVDVILCDPPYNINIRNGTGQSSKDQKLCEWDVDFDVPRFFKECMRLISPNGMVYIFGRYDSIFDYPKPDGILVWDKMDYDIGDLRIWSMSYEFVMFWKFGDCCFDYNKRPLGIISVNKPQNYGSEDMRLGHNDNGNAMLHPTQKPIKLIRTILSYHKRANYVLDMCMGSGTTALACKQLGMHFLGFELSSEYCAIAENRLKQKNLKSFFEALPDANKE